MVCWQCHLFRIEPETDFARLDSVRPSCSSRDGVPLIKEGSTLPLKPSFQLLFTYRCFLIEIPLMRVRLYQKLWTFKNKCQKSHLNLQILVDRRSNQFECFSFYLPSIAGDSPRPGSAERSRHRPECLQGIVPDIILSLSFYKLLSWLLSRFGRSTWWLSRWQLLGGGLWVQSRRDGEQHLWEKKRGEAPNKVISNPYSCL